MLLVTDELVVLIEAGASLVHVRLDLYALAIRVRCKSSSRRHGQSNDGEAPATTAAFLHLTKSILSDPSWNGDQLQPWLRFTIIGCAPGGMSRFQAAPGPCSVRELKHNFRRRAQLQTEDALRVAGCTRQVHAGVGVDAKHVRLVDQRRVGSKQQALWACATYDLAYHG